MSKVLVYNCFAEENIKLEPVIITATRIHSEEERKMPVRSEDSIVLGEDDALSHFSVPSVLRDFSLTDVRTRGPYGVQSDISLRGAPFEQNLVLLDGVSINDPKSGHHNMDIPLTMHDIERVDVTYGPASSIYGSGALGGAVNIVPKKPEDKLRIFGSSRTGSWDFYSGSASLNIPAGALKTRNSVEWKRNTGFAPETEFNMLTASSFSELTFDGTKFDCFLGYLTKKFGADSFYSDLFPNEEESVNTGLLIASAEIKRDSVLIKPVFYWKRLQDKFILDRNRRSFSRNDHTTGIYGGEITSQVATGFGNVAFGALVGNEKISSTNLGKHHRVKSGAFLEYENRVEDLFLSASARIDYYSTFKTHFSPSLNLGYALFPELTVRAGWAGSFRVPTFTELYYSTVANKGNPNLKPEKAWNYETGLNYASDAISGSATVFLRNTEKIIDWTRKSPTSAWQAENIGEFDIYGVESSFKLELDVCNLSLRYAFLEGLDKKGIISKYVLEYLKHNLNACLEYKLPFGFREEVNFAFRKRIGSEKYFLLDLITYKDVELAKGKMNLFLKLSNVFNTEYCEQGDIKMPGFAIFGGGSVQF
ncbi:MAG: TonB-dependent receptor [Candidatus Omnitrophota bacterium]